MKTLAPIFLLFSFFLVTDCRAGFIRQTTPQSTDQIEDTKDAKTDLPDTDKVEPIGDVKNPENVQSDVSQDKKGRLVRVQIYGDELIREEVSINGQNVKRTTLRGNAIVVHQSARISAPLIVIDGGQKGQCTGGVTIEDKGAGLVITADRADYDRTAQTLILSGRPVMHSNGKGRKPAIITANRLVRNLGDHISIMEGDVRVFHDTFTITGANARYADSEKKIDLPDHPMVFGPGQFMTGTTLSYMLEAKQIAFHGDTVIVREEKADPVAKKQPDLETYARSGQSAQSGFLDPGGPGTTTANDVTHDFSDRDRPRTELRGDVLYTRTGLTLKAPLLESLGKSSDFLIGKEGVDVVDRKQNLHITAGVMIFERATKMLRLEQNPKIDFLKDNTDEVTGSLSGEMIERDFEKKTTVARGGVKLVQSDVTAVGQIATYEESGGALVLSGEPGIQQEKGFIRCEKIVYYPDKKRLLLMNRIHGALVSQ